MDRNYFQDIHYLKKSPNKALCSLLFFAELFYGLIINLKNFFYDVGFLKEIKVEPYVICIGNLTTGGVGKTPIVTHIANSIKDKKILIVSRGYKSKLNIKKPNIIKDYEGIKFKDGTICGDEPFEIAKTTNGNVAVITCSNRLRAIQFAKEKFNFDVVIFDDGFSNRIVKKDETVIVIDSKMRFGNNHLLPYGPLREPINQLKRADKIILVNKNDKNYNEAVSWAKKLTDKYNLKLNLAQISPKKIYNIISNAEIKPNNEKAIAFCAIGQPEQFFDFSKKFYNIKKEIRFNDHYNYTKTDIKDLIKTANKLNVRTFITTRKDEVKIKQFLNEFKEYDFNTLEIGVEIEEA